MSSLRNRKTILPVEKRREKELNKTEIQIS